MKKSIETGTAPSVPGNKQGGVGRDYGQTQTPTKGSAPKGSPGNTSGVSGGGSIKTFSNKGGTSHPTGQPGSAGSARPASKKAR